MIVIPRVARNPLSPAIPPTDCFATTLKRCVRNSRCLYLTRMHVIDAYWWRAPLARQVLVSTRKGPLLLRGVVILAAWLCYYRAARDLQLAELVTIYFAAPLMVTALSVMLLKEQVRWQRWAGTGTARVTSSPAGSPRTAPSAKIGRPRRIV